MKNLIIAFFLYFFSSAIFAFSYPVVVSTTYTSNNSGINYPSPDALCTAETTPPSGYTYGSYGSGCNLFQNGVNQGYPNNPTFRPVNVFTCPGGGTFDNFSTCTGASDCPAGSTRDPVTYICSTPSPTCTSGQTSVISVVSSSLDVDNVMTINVNAASNSPTVTACYNGCSYTYNGLQQPIGDVSFVDPADKKQQTFSNYNATNTGQTCSSGSPGQSKTIPTPTSAISKPNSNCAKDKAGKEICATAAGEGTINGVPYKLKDGVACQVVPGFAEPLCAGFEKNCGSVNGKMVCVADVPPSKGGADYSPAKVPEVVCHEDVLGFKHCMTVEDGVKQKTTTTSETKPNGDVVTTTTTTNNVQGTSPSVTTETKHPDGTTEKTKQGEEGGTGDTKVGSPDLAGLDSSIDAYKNTLNFTSRTSNDYIQPFFQLPAGNSCITIPMHYKSLNYTFDPCQKLAVFRAMIGWFFYVITGFFIFQIAIGRD